ncbi:hypothetical protein GF362_03180 [Candidatus Dojkabacteria bacterium]|nr:hypothetical protein [Candidatus Dojkabacteria bacterium]
MKGYIFRCNDKTKDEVFERMLFGEEEAVKASMMKITLEDYLFLYNTSTFEFSGPYKPTTAPNINIEGNAWQGRFPVQIRFETTDQTKTIPFNLIERIITAYRKGIYPHPELTKEQTTKILSIIAAS